MFCQNRDTLQNLLTADQVLLLDLPWIQAPNIRIQVSVIMCEFSVILNVLHFMDSNCV